MKKPPISKADAIRKKLLSLTPEQKARMMRKIKIAEELLALQKEKKEKQ